MTITFHPNRCIGCGSCAILCPVEAITISPDFVAVIDTSLCTECLTCIDCCASEALEET